MIMNKKIFRSILAIAGYILISYSQLLAQPYYFYLKPIDEWNLSIYRLDLSSGVEEPFTDETFHSANLAWDPTQTWLYIYPELGPALVINIANPSIADTLPSESTRTVGHVMSIFFVPQEKEFYVTWTPAWGSDTFKTNIYSSETFDSLGSVNVHVGNGGILSRDGTKLYYDYGIVDASNKPDYLHTFSTISNAIVDSINLSAIGPQAYVKVTEDGKLGNILTRYYYPSSGNENTHYFLYDIESNKTYTPIHFPFRSYAYLSGDAKNIIIEQVKWDTTLASAENYTGIVYIFNAKTGELNQRLSLPPGGKILIFDNYPGKFYYYNDSTNQSIAVNDTIVTPVTALIDTLISLKHQAVANGWLADGTSHEKGKGEDNSEEDGIVRRLDQRLDKAKEALVKGDSVKSREELEQFVKEVEHTYHQNKEEGKREGVPLMTSEAYALLKYNAEYLIDRLPKEGRKGKDE